jgi:hypothetical protein
MPGKIEVCLDRAEPEVYGGSRPRVHNLATVIQELIVRASYRTPIKYIRPVSSHEILDQKILVLILHW